MTFPTWSVGEVLTAADMNTVGAICSTSVTSFKNVIINGDFSINQRGLNSSGQVDGVALTTGAFGQDHWRRLFSGGTVTYSAQAFTLGNAITGQEPANFLRIATSGQSAAGNYAIINQPIESVRTFAGQTITVSFWAKAGSGTPKIALELTQDFGTGGSPSAAVQTYGGQVTISTSWARYQLTVAVPSISGKTLGTANNDQVAFYLWTSAGTDFNSRTGSLGIQNATIDFWGVQVEAGSVMTVFERRPRQVELALCQRYYWRTGGTIFSPFSIVATQSTTAGRGYINLPTTMRTSPTALNITGSAPGVGTGTYTSFILDRATPDVIMGALTGTGYTAGGANFFYGNGDATTFIEFTGAELP